MNIETFKVYNYNLPLILPFIIISILVFLYTYYYFFKNKLKTNVVFDITVILLVSGLIFARLLGIINYGRQYLNLGWGFLPFSDNETSVSLFHTLPWEFFNIFDTNVILWGLPIGVAIGAVILYVNSNKRKNALIFLEQVVLAMYPAYLVILIGALISQFYYGSEYIQNLSLKIDAVDESRLSIAGIEVMLAVIILLCMLIVKIATNKAELSLSVFFTAHGSIGLFLVPKMDQINNPLTFQLIAAPIVTIGLTMLLYSTITSIKFLKKINKSPLDKEGIIIKSDNNEIFQQQRYSDIEFHRKSESFISRVIPWKKR